MSVSSTEAGVDVLSSVTETIEDMIGDLQDLEESGATMRIDDMSFDDAGSSALSLALSSKTDELTNLSAQVTNTHKTDQNIRTTVERTMAG